MHTESNSKKSKVGRKPKADPAIHRHYARLNEADNIRFETMFHLSGYKYPAHFIRDKVLNSSLKVKIIDKASMDYIIKLSQFRGQMRKIGNNYNQLLRLLKEQLGEKKALAYLYKLEKVTIELVTTYKEIEVQLQQLEEEWLQK
ncbi:MobA protein [Dysgonomonas sp. 521]|uniref:plasmid mobilization protein n=1 Tax=Dysgonomonas sp. 521 TaxID=2302932 RepID=UPI0013D8784B|nr:MobA protein [Dysgonomonas sp. 521]NDV97081.1 MobA protein [Dysgonomonas sp. 521]